MLAIEEHGGDEGFTLFGPLKRNTLCPRENGSCITVCSSSAGLTLDCLGLNLSILTSVAAFYSKRTLRLHCGIGPDMWPQGGRTPIP
jgi:hypothetical protein